MHWLIKKNNTLLILLLFSELSFGQVIVDSCFTSASPGTGFASSSNLANNSSIEADLLVWTGSGWTGGWPSANLTIPPPNNGVGCRAIFIGNGVSWTTGGEGFGLRLSSSLVSGQTYTFNITYVSHGNGSNGSFGPRFFTNNSPTITGAYLVGNLTPVGYTWTTNSFTFTATVSQSGHNWILIHSGPSGSSGLINNFCPSCNIVTCNPSFNPVGPYCFGASIPALPTTSTNGITGTWSPVINNTMSTTYTFTPNNGTCFTTATLTITINPNVNPVFIALGPYCVGATPGILPATSTNGISGTWNPSTINTATAGTSTYTFNPTAGQCATTTTMSVTVNPNVTPAFTALGPYCVGATPGILPTTSTNGISGTWNPSTINTTSAGTSIYTFTPTAGQCATTTIMSVAVNSNITPSFTTLGPYCVGATPGTLPTTSTNGINGTWSPSTISTISAGTSTYTFTPTAGQCATTTTMSVSVSSSIAPTFTSLGPYCVGTTPVTLPTTSTNGINGTWSPAIINTASAGASIYTFTPTTGQCATTTTMTVTVNSNITPAFTTLGPYCIGATSDILPNTSTNGIIGTWNPATINTATAGISIYTFIPTAGQCATTQTLNVTVNPSPVLTASASPATICFGASSSLHAISSIAGTTYLWMPGSINGIDVSVSPSTTLTYTLVGTAAGCSSSDTITITVNPNPVISSSASPASVCYGQCSDLTASGADTYTWMPGSLSGMTINICPMVTTVYTVTGTSAFGCTNTETITVGVTPMPVIITNASNDTLCIGQSTELSAGGAYNLQWQPGSLIGAYVNVSPTTTTTYTVTGDINGCIATGNITINVYPYPNIVFSSDKYEGCEDLLVQFTDQSNFDNALFYWEFGDNTFSYEPNPMHYYYDPGVYDVSLTLTSVYGCSSSFTWSEMITVYKSPMAEFITIPEFASELESTIWFFDRSLGASAWEWYFGEYSSMHNNSNEQNPTHVYSDTGLFTVILIAITDNGCRDTTAHTVYIEPNVSFYVPNAFTPNDDSKNSNFIAQGEGIDWSTFEMRIYNRWGHQLLYTKDNENGWNGEYNGVEVPEGVYTWIISFTDIKLKKHNLKGIVTLIK